MDASNERCHRTSIDFKLPSSFVLSFQPRLSAPFFRSAASLSFSETAREEDEMLLHLSSGEYKARSFLDRTSVYKIQFKNGTFFIHRGTGAVASCYSGKIYIVSEMLEERSRLHGCCRFESGSELSVEQNVGLLFCSALTCCYSGL